MPVHRRKRRSKAWRLGSLLALAACLVPGDGLGAAKAPYARPLIDAHSHFIARVLTADELVGFIDAAGIDRVVLFGKLDELRAATKAHPDRIVPFMTPFRPNGAAGTLEISPKALRGADKALRQGLTKGFGEIYARLHRIKPFAPDGINSPADAPGMLALYDIAASHGVPVTVHLDHGHHEELERALAHNRQARIVWAHCGYADPALIRRMLDTHPNLYGDLSVIADPTKRRVRVKADGDGVLPAEWTRLLEDYAHRLMFGIDMGKSKRRYKQAAEVAAYFRRVLGQLSLAAAENIAHRTILGLLGKASG